MEYIDTIQNVFLMEGKWNDLIEDCRQGKPRLHELSKAVDLHGWYSSDPVALQARQTLRAAANREAALTLPYANHLGFSDVHPYEVVRRVSETCLEVRGMKSVRANPENNLGFVAGGFHGHCANQDEQEWIIESDPSLKPQRIRLHKDGHWYDPWKNRFALAAQPRKFHDYNF